MQPWMRRFLGFQALTAKRTTGACKTSHLLVVIKDDDHVGVQEAGMVHGLIRHAACDGAIADDLHDLRGKNSAWSGPHRRTSES